MSDKPKASPADELREMKGRIAKAVPALLTDHARLVEENRRLRGIARGFLDCPEIADCAPDDKDPETDRLEREARAALSSHQDGGGDE